MKNVYYEVHGDFDGSPWNYEIKEDAIAAFSEICKSQQLKIVEIVEVFDRNGLSSREGKG